MNDYTSWSIVIDMRGTQWLLAEYCPTSLLPEVWGSAESCIAPLRLRNRYRRRCDVPLRPFPMHQMQ